MLNYEQKAGFYNISLQVIDDNLIPSNTMNTSVNVTNQAPVVSLTNGSSTYNISFEAWGTGNGTVNITLFGYYM